MSHKIKRNLNLSPKKRELFYKMAQVQGLRPSVSQTIPARNRHETLSELPLSFAQQRLWLIDQLTTGNAVYNVPCVVLLKGVLAPVALQSGLTEIVRRHETLRTRFPIHNGNPIQEILGFIEQNQALIDLSALSEATRKEQINELRQREAGMRFNLQDETPIRVKLLKLQPDENILLVTMHHLISDGWSIEVMLFELTKLYESFRMGRPSSLQELEIQYADFAVWQRQLLQGEILPVQLAYWKRQLTGVAMLNLPTDRPRPPLASNRGATVPFTISAKTTEKLKALSRSEGVTLFMTVLAAFQIVLCRYAGQDDIVVGTSITNRNHVETEKIIGFFVNQIALRVDLAGNPTFRESLERVKQTTLEAYEHQDLPFEKLVEELSPERDLARSPIFQVALALHSGAQGEIQAAGVNFNGYVADYGVARFDLLLSLNEFKEYMSGAAEYAADLYDGSSIEQLLKHLSLVLELMIDDMGQRVRDISLLTVPERQQVLLEWNDTKSVCDELLCLHEIFERQAERDTDAVAVVCGKRQLSYGEINRRANQFAHYLRRKAVGPEVKVGICLDRSPEMITAILGVLKAGGAYVPLDPNYPGERLQYMLNDSDARLMLATGKYLLNTTGMPGKRIILDNNYEEIHRESAVDLGAICDINNLAYVIYTSGSTGQPKGVGITHSNVVMFLNWAYRTYPKERLEGILASTSICFDLSIYELFLPLCFGGRVVLVENALTLANLDAWADVTMINSVPSAIQALLNNGDVPPSVRSVNLAGEVVSSELVRKLYADCSIEEVYNLYGPSETTTYSTFMRVKHAGVMPPPIGRPISDTQVYLLDERKQPVMSGARGELYIGGSGLSRGYLNKPEITAERFIPSPYGSDPGDRLYRTGDLGRHCQDGNIAYLGRIDQQVKIHGYRIEPGEIESALLLHNDVQKCAVCLKEDELGEKRLVAYVVSSTKDNLSIAELRSYLRAKLPEYMVPWRFMDLPELPLTSNGKLDLKALPEPKKTLEQINGARTPVEEILCGIWAHLLRAEKIGIYQNFFELGGHSLLAFQAVSRIRDALEVDLPLRALFEKPTVAELADVVENERSAHRLRKASPILRVARDQVLPLSYAQQRLLFIQQLEPENTAYNIPIVIRLRGKLDISALRRSLCEMKSRHEVLRTRFESIDGMPVQLIDEQYEMMLPVWDISDLEEEERENQAGMISVEEAQRSFDLIRGPLWRASLLRLSPEDHVLLLDLHHVVGDEWSTNVFLNEFIELYGWCRQGKIFALPDLCVQYADFAVWQREWLQGEVLEKQKEYWLRRFEGEPIILELPTDRPRAAVLSIRGAKQSFALLEGVSASLHSLCRREGVTSFMLLLTGFQTLLLRYTAQPKIIVGTPIANRNRIELEKLIGFFTNTIVIPTDMAGDPPFGKLLRRVREAVLEAYAHQDLPFEKLVEYLQPERSFSRAPLFQIMFVLQNAPRIAELEEITLSMHEGDNSTEKFDLTLTMREDRERFTGTISYNTDLFDAATICRMSKHLCLLFEAIALRPEEALSQLEILAPSERRQIVEEWNDTASANKPAHCLQEMFEIQVADLPDKVAVVIENQWLSYRALNSRANRWASYLRRLGVGPNVVVGICLERSIDMALAVLATFKAGGAYLPLDPSYPQDRLSFMVEDGQAHVLLTQLQLAGKLSLPAAQIICIDKNDDILSVIDDENLGTLTKLDDLGYVIYTSGSTGRPKGTALPQRALANLIEWHLEIFPSKSRILQFSSLSFDASFHEMFAAWCGGGTLFILSEEIKTDAGRIALYILENAIERVNLPAVMLQQLAKECENDPWLLANLSEVISTAEQLQITKTVDKLFRHLDSVSLHNHYGPSETHVVTFYCLDRNPEEWTIRVPIGRPILNTQIYILDANLNPVPIGISGELYIGGVSLADGYLRRSDLTAERFVPAPFTQEPGARHYKTGDLCHYMCNGNIEFLGRLDHQIKIRGFRVEPGEVENIIRQQRIVKEAVVVVKKDDRGEARLISYLLADEGSVPSVNELRRQIKDKLPEYMVPAEFIMIDEMPLNPNGKIDRRVLLSLNGQKLKTSVEYVAPRNSIEEEIVAACRDLLKVERVGIYDDFFSLGGHSLLLTQLASRIRGSFQVDLSLRAMFDSPTVADMAKAVKLERVYQAEPHELDELLNEIEQLSPDDVRNMLDEASDIIAR